MTDFQTNAIAKSSLAQHSAAAPEDASLQRTRLAKTILAVLTLFALALLPWIPFGWNIGFVADDWWLFSFADQGIITQWTTSRPLIGVTFAVAHLLDANSFMGPNLLLAGTLFLKGLLLYGIVKILICRADVAFAVGALFVIFPADQAVFNLGTLTYYFMIVCFLLAVYLFIASYQNGSHQKASLLWFPLIWLALATSMLINEVEFPLVAVTPALLLLIVPRLSRRFWLYTVLWYLTPMLVVGRLILLQIQAPQGLNYEQRLYAGIPTVAQVISSFENVFRSLFISGWKGYDYFPPTTFDWLPAILGGIAVFAMTWALGNRFESKNIRTWISGIVIGLAAIMLGFVLYLPTPLRDGGGRTLVYSSLGGAVVLGIVIYLLGRLLRNARFWLALGIGVFVTLGVVSLERQHRIDVTYSDSQQQVLRNIVGQFGQIKSGSTLVVFDPPHTGAVAGRFGSSAYLTSSLELIYTDATLTTAICYPEPDWGAFKETCSFTPTGLQLKYNDAVQWTQPYQNLIALEYKPSGTISIISDLQPYETSPVDVSAYHPDALFDPHAPKPLRAQTMLGMLP